MSAHGKDERHMRAGVMQVANVDLNIDGERRKGQSGEEGEEGCHRTLVYSSDSSGFRGGKRFWKTDGAGNWLKV